LVHVTFGANESTVVNAGVELKMLHNLGI